MRPPGRVLPWYSTDRKVQCVRAMSLLKRLLGEKCFVSLSKRLFSEPRFPFSIFNISEKQRWLRDKLFLSLYSVVLVVFNRFGFLSKRTNFTTTRI